METKSIIKDIQKKGGYITTDELSDRMKYEKIRHASRMGDIIRLKNGVYADIGALANNMIDVERIVPGGVVCLYNAFRYHNLSTQVPSSTCIAIEAKRKVVLPDYPIIELYYWKKDYLKLGVSKKKVNGYKVYITDLERTVCDAVKYRNKIGLDVCGEVINDYLKRSDCNIPRLHEYAARLRIKNILNRYLETRL